MGARGTHIAIDWGTSNRRAFLLDGAGGIVDAERDGRGVLAVGRGEYGVEIAGLRARFGAMAVVAAGMVGSTLGWREVAYRELPLGLDQLAQGVERVDDGVVLVPGAMVANGRRDVMRGEETLVLGAVAAGTVPPDATVCQPGTHNKWIRLEGGRIVDFATAMTGELFAALKAGGTLATMLDGPVTDDEVFREGLARGRGATDLATALFEARAAVVTGARAAAATAGYVSGVLIGADVGHRRAAKTYLVGSGPLVELYAAAIGQTGGEVVRVDGEAAFVAGAHAIWETMQ